MYHGGELLSGLTYLLCGGSITTFIFGNASKFFNNPIGEKSKQNRDAISDIFIGCGQTLVKVPNTRARTAGSVSLALGQTMRRTNSETEFQYKKLQKSKSLHLSLSENYLMYEVRKSTQSLFTKSSISLPNQLFLKNKSPFNEPLKNSTGEIRAVFYLSSDEE